MKTLKFRLSLAQMILQGKKSTTWRLFDDKDLSVGDEVSFLVFETKQEFAKARIIEVNQTTFSALSSQDREGHESFASEEEMFKQYTIYYKKPVTKETPLKIIKFKILSQSL